VASLRHVNIDDDVEFISNSLRMLPPWDWDEGSWWPQFGELAGFSKDYLTEKMAWITTVWREADLGERELAGDRTKYVLMSFDNPALYDHLDAVAGTWGPQVPGAVGRRWSEGISAAAWRVLVATEPDNVYRHNFAAPRSYY
jgi:hypothetical protein